MIHLPRFPALSLLVSGFLGLMAGMRIDAAPLKLVEQAPVSVNRIDDKVILVDFGRVAFGNLELKLPSAATTPITVHFGEAFKNGRIDRKPPGTVRYNLTTIEPKGKTSVIAAPPPDERNTALTFSQGREHPPAILTRKEWGVLIPFRWAEIEGWPGDLKPEQITRRSSFLAAWNDDAASFECSDNTLNRIWELCRYSIKATTFAGIYVDGDRERIPYEADAYLNQLSHYYTDNDLEIARDTIDHLLLNPTWPTEWAPHMVFMVWELAAIRPYTGELAFAKGMVPTPRGPIRIDWQNDVTFTISIHLPKGMPALVDLPARDETTAVTINGNPAKAERRGDRWILQEPVTGDARIEVK